MKPTGMKDSWYELMQPMLESKNMEDVKTILRKTTFCPDFKKVFRAFSFFEVEETKCVFVFLSPYQSALNGIKKATGLATGVPSEEYDTPTLKVIRDALCQETGIITIEDYFDYTLESWANQGVLLLNSALTVPLNGDARAHIQIWKWFMKPFFEKLSEKLFNVPFVFFGKDAQMFTKYVTNQHIINVCHPMRTYYLLQQGKSLSSISIDDNFINSNIFNTINNHLKKINGSSYTINWLNNLDD